MTEKNNIIFGLSIKENRLICKEKIYIIEQDDQNFVTDMKKYLLELISYDKNLYSPYSPVGQNLRFPLTIVIIVMQISNGTKIQEKYDFCKIHTLYNFLCLHFSYFPFSKNKRRNFVFYSDSDTDSIFSVLSEKNFNKIIACIMSKVKDICTEEMDSDILCMN